MTGRITKVKRGGDKVEIHSADSQPGKEKETVFRCTEKAHPDFNLAFDSLIRHVYMILSLPTSVWATRMKITGVSFSLSEETMIEGAVITGQVEIETSNAPFCFNTPHLAFDQYSPTGNSPIMDEAAVRDLEHLRTEATAYMDGKRAQLELPVTVSLAVSR